MIRSAPTAPTRTTTWLANSVKAGVTCSAIAWRAAARKKFSPATVAPSQKDLDAVDVARLKRERRTQKKAQQAQKE